MTITHPSTTGFTRTPATPIRWAGFAGWLATTALVTSLVAHGGAAEGSAPSGLLLAVAVTSFIAPDLTFLIGAGQPAPKGYLPRRAVPYYNAMHQLWGPLALIVAGGLVAPFAPAAGSVLLVVSLSWAAHVLMDRAAGYGLRRPDGGR
jgi:integral membrane sensor domain MASE1